MARDSALARAVEGKVVLLTGASSGIGRAAAVRLGDSGAQLALLARREEELDDVVEEIGEHGGEASAHPCDLTNTPALEATVGDVLERYGHVDVLVNNAGHSIRRTLAESEERFTDFERLIQLNYLAAVRLTQLVLPGMREQHDGLVVNVSSMAVQLGTPRFSAYTASKAALDAFARCASAECRADGIHFTTINMPLARTPMIAPSSDKYRGMPSIGAHRAAEMIADAIVHRPARITTPMGEAAQLGHALTPGLTAVALRVGIGAGSAAAREEPAGRSWRSLPGSGLAEAFVTRTFRR